MASTLLIDGLNTPFLLTGGLQGSVAPPTGPTTATLSGPTNGPVGGASTNFTITLDAAAPSGGVSCPVTSSNGSDTVTSSPVVIASGQMTGTFTVSAVGAGLRNITLGATTPSLTIAGSPISYLATAGPSPPSGGSSVTTFGMGIY